MSFTDSFWSSDYNLGVRALFEQLYEGTKENEAYIQVFKKRLELEMMYGSQLLNIENTSVNSKRLQSDDYVSSVKNAYQKINENFSNQGQYHMGLSEQIDANVIDPFSKWCQDHKLRVEYSDSILTEKYKSFKQHMAALDKTQKKYFNKCRILEEFKSRYDEDELEEVLKHGDDNSDEDDDHVDEDDEYNSILYSFGDIQYSEKTLKNLLIDLLSHIEVKSHKVPILGTYNNVSTGSSITQWLLDNIKELENNIVKAEEFGQDLIDHDFIRLIGSINNNKNFINSSQFYYQWKHKAFELTKLEEFNENLSRNASLMKGNHFTDYFEDMKQVIGVNSVDFNDSSQYYRTHQEVKQLDDRYYQLVLEFDKLRCEFEELIMDHLTFMEKCELDRLKAIKKVLFDFLKIFHHFFKDNKQFLNELLVLEETINPVNDLSFLVENFKVGKFKPTVVLYDNYYDSNVKQTFGVDLNIKSRLDKKIVPILIQCILSHLDRVYPDVVNDEERINLWVQPVQLGSIHNLRFQLNDLTTADEITSVLKGQHPMIITNLLKLYLLELPDSLISSSYYEIIKTLYHNYPVHTNDESMDNSRINGLQNVLVELPKCNLATLDALLTHLNRLVQIIGKKNSKLAQQFQVKLSKEFSSIIIIPKNHEHFAQDNFQFNFLMDLFHNKDYIFGELRRQNSTEKSRPSSTKSKKPRNLAPGSKANSPQVESLKPGTSTPMESPSTSMQEVESPSISHDSSLEKFNNEFDSALAIETPSKTTNSGFDDDDDVPIPLDNEGSTTPNISEQPTLKRSTSPNKKSLNSYLDRGSPIPNRSHNNSSNSVVSSKPNKKDIVYDDNLSEFSPPKFAPSLGRRTSVKDLASKFDSAEKLPETKSSASSQKST